ncbi:MAG TPA: exosortase A [Casimicrobiaceae bacterium]
MGDAAQWVRGLVGRRSEGAATGRKRPIAEPRAAAAEPSASTGDAVRADGPVAWPATWRLAPVLAAGLAVLGIVALYWPTVASIVAIWIRSETFTHGFVVVPICLWLVWRRREVLAAIPVRPWWPGLAIVCAAGALWLVTSVADVLGVKQFALAFMLQAAIVTVLGTRIARAAFFPLAFLLFAVPFGEIFVPTLIEWTANFTVSALRWSGVPVYREANLFIIPSGAWSVVEACSGIRYIIASVMVGTIYAAVAYRSTRRRAMFIAASILVPVIANWLRAYMIVMIGHLSNNRLAVGVDHIVYGWVFFGLVMLLLFWVGSFWQEDDVPAEAAPALPPAAPTLAASGRVLFTAAIAAIVAAGLWLPLEASKDRLAAAGTPAVPVVAAANGWNAAPAAFTDWKPYYHGYVAELQQAFRQDGRDVGLYIAYYRRQTKGSELITSGNLLAASGDWKWKQVAEGSDRVEWAGRPERVERAELSGRTVALEAFRFYWVAGKVTSSQYVAKALLAWSKLTGRGDDSALIVLYAPKRTHDDDAAASLRAFARAMSPSIERALAGARESRG